MHLRMYESSTLPHTYSVVRTRKGYAVEKLKTETICAIGATFETAFRGFRDEFKQLTGVAWEDRFQFPERKVRDALAKSREKNSGFVTPSMVLAAGGARHTSSDKQITASQIVQFHTAKFKWMAPPEGEPQGEMAPRPPSREELANIQANVGAQAQVQETGEDKNLDDALGATDDSQNDDVEENSGEEPYFSANENDADDEEGTEDEDSPDSEGASDMDTE